MFAHAFLLAAYSDAVHEDDGFAEDDKKDPKSSTAGKTKAVLAGKLRLYYACWFRS